MSTTATAGFFLSPQQKHIWASLAETPDKQSRTQIAVSITGDLDELRLRAAFQRVADAHAALPTVSQWQTGMKVRFQVVHELSRLA